MNKETKENTKSPSKKIPYTKPTITCVKLDPKQAILATCTRYSAPGAWIDSSQCVYAGTDGPFTPCPTGPRGSVHSFNFRIETDSGVAGS